MKALGISALVFSVSGCETLDFTGNDARLERIEVTPQECQDRGGVTVVSNSGEKICSIEANTYDEAVAAAPAAAASSAGGAGTAAAIAGLSLVLVLAVSDSSSGTR
ncbi:hypothetical protein [uncultured Pelagimonas sp.]|uniref:hypothetical protein n=1 Tax=uncultured Pelagimonas sp. TaxID=1618102 RepID=UPI002609803C|nr:hypothetical protein [uncultured Pelagimonas sp.]